MAYLTWAFTMKTITYFSLGLLGLALLLPIAGRIGWLAGKAPDDLGVREGRLKPPSDTPNSVSSQANLYPSHPQQKYAYLPPFNYRGDSQQAMQRLAGLLSATAGCVMVKQEPVYLYAQCRTKLLNYTDDIEFYLDEQAGVIHVRSASRLGHSDLGANRKRIEAWRQRFD